MSRRAVRVTVTLLAPLAYVVASPVFPLPSLLLTVVASALLTA